MLRKLQKRAGWSHIPTLEDKGGAAITEETQSGVAVAQQQPAAAPKSAQLPAEAASSGRKAKRKARQSGAFGARTDASRRSTNCEAEKHDDHIAAEQRAPTSHNVRMTRADQDGCATRGKEGAPSELTVLNNARLDTTGAAAQENSKRERRRKRRRIDSGAADATQAEPSVGRTGDGQRDGAGGSKRTKRNRQDHPAEGVSKRCTDRSRKTGKLAKVSPASPQAAAQAALADGEGEGCRTAPGVSGLGDASADNPKERSRCAESGDNSSGDAPAQLDGCGAALPPGCCWLAARGLRSGGPHTHSHTRACTHTHARACVRCREGMATWRHDAKRTAAKSGAFSAAEDATIMAALRAFAEAHALSTTDWAWVRDMSAAKRATQQSRKAGFMKQVRAPCDFLGFRSLALANAGAGMQAARACICYAAARAT